MRRLIARCLERDSRLRLRDIGEARIALTPGAAIDPAHTPADAPPAARAHRRAVWMTAAAGVVVAAAAGTVAWRAKPVTPVPVRRIELSDVMTAAAAHSFALSPDGTSIADGALRLRRLDSLDTRDLGAVPLSATNVFWSPDGRLLGFSAEGAMRTIPAAGGAVFTVCKVPASGRVLDAVWRPDGTIVFSVWRDDVYQVPAAGGTPGILVPIDPARDVDFHAIAELPDGRLLLDVHGHENGADLRRNEIVEGGRRTVLATTSGAPVTLDDVEYADGHLLFLRDAPNVGLWAVSFDGGPVDMTKAILVQAAATAFSAAAEGTLLVEVRGAGPGDVLTWVDRSGHGSAPAGSPLAPVGPHGFALSPGDRVLYAVEHTVEDMALVARPADGSGGATALTSGEVARHAGRTRAALPPERPRAQHLRRAPINPDGTLGTSVLVFHGQNPDVFTFDVSPDGRVLAYAAADSDRQLDVFLTDYPSATGRWQVASGASHPRFSHDGRELFYVQGSRTGARLPEGQMTVVSVTSRPGVALGVAKTLFSLTGAAEYDMTPDGQRFLTARPSGSGEVRRRVVLVQNWPRAIGDQ